MTTYATPAETLVTLASALLESDERRTLFEALSTADQTVLVEQATADLNALAYRGYCVSDTVGMSWPRRKHRGGSPLIDPDPAEPADATVAGLPRRVRFAHAIQAAHLAREAAGLGNAGRLADAAHRGVVSASESGRAEAIDIRRATGAEARLDVDAYAQLRPYLSIGGDIA